MNETSDFALARFRPDGTLDSNFGTNGTVTTNFGGQDFLGSIAIQSDGKIVAAGYITPSSNNSNFLVARYNANGSLDPTFGTGGRVITDFAGLIDQAVEIAIQPDGKIVVVGSAQRPGPYNSHYDFALARYNINGTLDLTFNGTGKL